MQVKPRTVKPLFFYCFKDVREIPPKKSLKIDVKTSEFGEKPVTFDV